MNIELIQSQLATNRQVIAEFHAAKACAKLSRSKNSQMGDQHWACEYHKEVVYWTKHIARMVRLQKALKADMQQALSMRRAERLVANGFLVDYLAAWEKHEGVPEWQAKREAEEKGKAAREAAQLRLGEFY